MVQTIFNNAETKGHLDRPQDRLGNLWNDAWEVFKPLLVHTGTTRVLSQANHQHLTQAALNGALEVRMDFNAVDRDDIVGAAGIFVCIDRNASLGGCNPDCVH